MRLHLFSLALTVALLSLGDAGAADLTKVDRRIRKEPAYESKPKYCLLVFGPEAKHRVWLVLDGDVLYVRSGCVHRVGHRYPAKARGRVAFGLRLAAGRGRSGSRASNQSNTSRGFLPKNRSAAVVPSSRSVR